MTERSSEQREARLVSVGEAADVLGISKDAVRMRIRRGTLRSEKTDDRVYVWLDDEAYDDQDTVHPQGQVEALLKEKDRRIEELLGQVHHLREILEKEGDARRRADTIIVQLTQANAALAARVPELEAPSEPPGSSERVVEEPERTEPLPASEGAQEGAQQPWWRRMFRS